MFHYLYEWAQDLAVFLILITAVLNALPDSGYKKYIRFFTGLVLTFMMLTPVLKVLGTDGQIMNFYKSRKYEEKVEEMEKAAQYFEEYISEADAESISAAEGEKEGGGGIRSIEVEEIQTDEDR